MLCSILHRDAKTNKEKRIMKENRYVVKKDEEKAVEKLDGVFLTTLTYNDETMLCHFLLKKGAVVPLHEHPAVQNGYVMSGKVRFKKSDGSTFDAPPGTAYLFDSNEPHGAEALEESELFDYFTPSRPEYMPE